MIIALKFGAAPCAHIHYDWNILNLKVLL